MQQVYDNIEKIMLDHYESNNIDSTTETGVCRLLLYNSKKRHQKDFLGFLEQI
jgi:hypothetical protein